MKYLISFLLLHFAFILSAQNTPECEQLSIKVHGIAKTENSNQLLIECSNALYSGNLYYYPGFVLLNETGDTLAKEKVTYYGIGNNFQIHRLEIKSKIPSSFKGTLELYGSKYQNLFCSYPIEITAIEQISLEEIQNEKIKVATTINKEFIVLDLGGSNINSEELKYKFNITNAEGEIVYSDSINTNVTHIVTKELGEKGIYIISIWDEIRKKLLPSTTIEIN